MGFGINLNVKVEAPKVEVPKVDIASAAKGAVDSAKAAVSGATASATSAVSGAVGAVTGAVSGAVAAASGAAAALSNVAGAIADVAASFTGAIEDLVLEPHCILDANASFGDTKFEKGPIWVRVDLTTEEAQQNDDTIHLWSGSGAYDEKRRICEYHEDDEHGVDVRFDDAPMSDRFSLEILPASGDPKVIFKDVPYGDLRKSKRRFRD
jgi:hypothetical protein